jgi:hypothetical protein
MKIFKILKKRCKGSASFTLVFLIMFIIGCILLIEITHFIQLKFKLLDKQLTLKLYKNSEVLLLKNRIQLLIIKKLVESIDQKQQLLSKQEIFQLIVNILPSKIKNNTAIKVEYIHNNQFVQLPNNNKQLQTMILYDNIENSYIALWITIDNVEYYYAIPLNNLIEFSNVVNNYNNN